MTRQKSVLHYFLLFCILLTTTGCDDHEKEKEAEIPPIACSDPGKLVIPEGYREKQLYTLVFLDYTDSQIVGVKSKAMLKRIMNDFLISPGDRVDIHFITPNTATEQASSKATYLLKIEERKKMIKDASLDSIWKCKIYACNRLQAIDSFEKDLEKIITEQEKYSDTARIRSSDIAGLLHIVDNKFSHSDYKNFEKTICIISDMEHNHPGYFKLTGTEFSSEKNKALGNVDNDTKIISEKVTKEIFKGVSIILFRGDIPEENKTSLVQIETLNYWDQLFKNLGCVKNNNY